MRALVFLLAACLLLSTTARAELRFVNRTTSGKLIVFVHGLWGDPALSFTSAAGQSWPDLMISDTQTVRGQTPLATYSIATLSFPAGRNDRLSLPQIATNLLTDLLDTGVFDTNQELYFISHSLGGLALKEMFLNEAISRRTPLLERTKAIFFIATPSSGTEAAAFVGRLPTAIPGRLVVDIRTIADNSFLQALQNKWHELLRVTAPRPAIYCAYETRSVFGLLVVPQQYADTYCDEIPRAENEDHISIVKPGSHSSPIYVWVRGRLAELGVRRASRAWSEIKDTKDIALLEAFARQHEGTEFAEIAKQRAAALRAPPPPAASPAPQATVPATPPPEARNVPSTSQSASFFDKLFGPTEPLSPSDALALKRALTTPWLRICPTARSAREAEQQLRAKGFGVLAAALHMTPNWSEQPSCYSITKPIQASMFGLGGAVKYETMMDEAKKYGIKECPWEIAPAVRLAVTDQKDGDVFNIATTLVVRLGSADDRLRIPQVGNGKPRGSSWLGNPFSGNYLSVRIGADYSSPWREFVFCIGDPQRGSDSIKSKQR